ncbi:class I adenylate-forming enzyme family protein [Prochlorothrix hollandica]|uniref:class I adenylate-forming enzyme family protein n=1 Tax=Prochlorothrix hollandica TaxID=1223 RepID=UPI003340B865
MDIFGPVSNPDSTLTDGILTCTYGDLPPLFGQIDAVLHQAGVGIQDPIVVECDNSLPTAIVLLALLSQGYSVLPIPQGLRSTLDHAPEGPAVIPHFCQHILTPNSKDPAGNPVDLGQVSQLFDVIPNPTAQAGERLGDRGHQKLYMRTSGSTGTPKVVMHSHNGLAANVQACVERLHLTADDRIALPVPLFHLYGLGAGFLPGIKAGASIDLQQGANLLRYLQREQHFNPNVAFLTPIFCETLLKGRRSDRPYRMTVAAGDRVREDTFGPYESRFGCLVKLYGSTEMGALTASSPLEPASDRLQSVGHPMADVEMRLVSSDQLTPEDVAKGIGELWCRRQAGFEGYLDWHGQPLDLGQWDGEGWFCTKDLGRLWPDGRVEVLGRCDHSVNRDGLLVFFADVERALMSLAAVESAVVVSKGESQRGKNLTAYCIPAQGQSPLVADLRRSCFEVLPNRAVPDHIVILDNLPLLANGKVDRQKLMHQIDAPD